MHDLGIARVIVAFGGHRDPDMVKVLRACSRVDAETPRGAPLLRTRSHAYFVPQREPLGHPDHPVLPAALRSTAYRVRRTVGELAGSKPGRPVAGTVSVVIPVLNEALNIGWVLQRIPDFVDEVVLCK